jgi:predicted aminopeptidase
MERIIAYIKYTSLGFIFAAIFIVWLTSLEKALAEIRDGIPGLFLLFGLIIYVLVLITERLLERYTSYTKYHIIRYEKYRTKSIPLKSLLEQNITDEWKEKLSLIANIKEYAKRLGFNSQGIYERFYDTKGLPCSFVLTGCKPDKLSPYLWYYNNCPVAYYMLKDEKRALREEAKLKSKGYETSLVPVLAFATRYKIKSPIFSVMLDYPFIILVSSIFHEIVHESTKPSNVDEVIATSISEKLTFSFIREKFGEGSKQMEEAKAFFAHKEEVCNVIRTVYKKLDALYSSGKDKEAILEDKKKIINEYGNLLQDHSQKHLKIFKQYNRNPPEINNAFIYSYYQYDKI